MPVCLIDRHIEYGVIVGEEEIVGHIYDVRYPAVADRCRLALHRHIHGVVDQPDDGQLCPREIIGDIAIILGREGDDVAEMEVLDGRGRPFEQALAPVFGQASLFELEAVYIARQHIVLRRAYDRQAEGRPALRLEEHIHRPDRHYLRYARNIFQRGQIVIVKAEGRHDPDIGHILRREIARARQPHIGGRRRDTGQKADPQRRYGEYGGKPAGRLFYRPEYHPKRDPVQLTTLSFQPGSGRD